MDVILCTPNAHRDYILQMKQNISIAPTSSTYEAEESAPVISDTESINEPNYEKKVYRLQDPKKLIDETLLKEY